MLSKITIGAPLRLHSLRLCFLSLLTVLLSTCSGTDSYKRVLCTPDSDKFGVIYGVTICTGFSVPKEYGTHVINVFKRLMDYNEDGIIDNLRVLESLKKTQPLLIVRKAGAAVATNYTVPIRTGLSIDHVKRGVAIDARGILADADRGCGWWQLLGDPPRQCLPPPEWDPAIRAVLLTIIAGGYAQVYPELALRRGSTIANHMDTARSGAGAYYTETACAGDACLIARFMYWAITTLRCHQKARASVIQTDWKASDPVALNGKDAALVTLLKKPEYGFHLPTTCP